MHRFIVSHRATTFSILSIALAVTGCSDKESGWTVSNEVDAMTDVSVLKAVSTVRGKTFNLETTVACGGAGKLVYQFRTFDQSGKAAPLKMDNIHGSFGKIAMVRIDGGKPYSHWDFSRFANQVSMTAREATDMAAGRSVVLRLSLVNGGETYTLDQSGSQVRSVLDACRPVETPKASLSPDAAVDLVDAPSDGGPNQSSGEGGVLDASAPLLTTENTGCWSPPSGVSIDNDPDRPITSDEVQEIEKATGRPFETGDSIYGRAEDRCPA